MPSTAAPHRADVLLVTVTGVETAAVFTALQQAHARPPTHHHIDHKIYYDLGSIGGARVWLVRSEMGTATPGGALPTIANAISALRPGAILMVGIAFGIDPRQQRIGDVLVSQQLLLYDLQRVGTGPSGDLQIAPRGDRPAASSRLLDICKHSALFWGHSAAPITPPRVRFGLLLSGDKLVDHQDFREQLQRLGPEAIGGEMEGAGLYLAASASKVDWIVVKAICDWADGYKEPSEDAKQQLAAENAALFVFHVLAQGGFASAAAAQPLILTAEARRPLRAFLDTRLSLAKLRTICFDLGIDYENLPGETKGTRISALIQEMEQRDRLRELLERVRDELPAVFARSELAALLDPPPDG